MAGLGFEPNHEKRAPKGPWREFAQEAMAPRAEELTAPIGR